MVATVEQIQAGVTKFIDSELAPKSSNLQKFMIYFSTPSILKWIEQKINSIHEQNIMPELFDEHGNIELDELYSRAKMAINKSGRIFIDKLNYFADEVDIEHLYNYIKSI